MHAIDNKYISNASDELTNLLGIKEDIPVETILKPFRVGNMKECIENIANYLGLPIVVNLSYVPARYVSANYQRGGNIGSSFESNALAKTDHTGRGVGGITAQVSIPSYLPFYGTSALQNFPISVKISDNCLRYPDTFMAVMAHELSHIVLRCLWHKEKENEFYTDLTAMILGFSMVMENGRKVVETRNKFDSIETLTTTYGYLSDEQFNFAFNKIKKMLEKNVDLYVDSKKKLLKRLTAYGKLLFSYKKELFRFKKFVEYLDKNQNKAIRKEDSPKIILFHQPDYTDGFTAVIRSNEEKLKEIKDSCTGLFHYTPHHTQQRLDSLQKFYDEIEVSFSDLKKKFDLLNKDVSILRKYVGFFYKFKVNRQARHVV